MHRRRLLRTIGVVAAAAAAPFSALSQSSDFPQAGRTVRWVVPFPAGGTSDLRARQVAEYLRQDLGWNIAVDNRAGASGMIGSDLVAKARPDGHTLLLGTIGTLAINPHMFPNQPYDVLRDLQPISQFSRSVTTLLAHRDTGFARLSDLERAARGGARLAYASTGTGTIGHMVGEIYQRRAGLQIVHVPYKGTAPAVQGFVSGQVPLLYETPSAVWEHIRAGTAVPLAVSSRARMPQMPSVPTFAELGHTGVVFDTWQGVLTTRGTPSTVVNLLGREVQRALRNPEIARSHEEQVNVVVANTPAEFERYIAEETARWGEVVRELSVQMG